MKSFRDFCATYDNLQFRQLIEDEFMLKDDSLSEEQANLLVNKLDGKNIIPRLTVLNENRQMDEEYVKELNEINEDILHSLTDIGVKNSDFKGTEIVGLEGLDFSKMLNLLKSIEKKIDDDKKSDDDTK